MHREQEQLAAKLLQALDVVLAALDELSPVAQVHHRRSAEALGQFPDGRDLAGPCCCIGRATELSNPTAAKPREHAPVTRRKPRKQHKSLSRELPEIAT